MTCREAPELGAYVLGALGPDERRAVEQHVDRCPACAAELAELAGLPALLDRVPHEDLEPVAVAPSAGLFDRVAVAAEVRPARRSRTRLLLAAAALLGAIGVGAGVTGWLGGGDDPRSRSASAGPVRATVSASADGDGTALDVTVAGLHAGEICTMVAVDDDGDRHPAGEWPTSPDGGGRWVGWTTVDPGALDEVLLLGDGGRELVRLDL
ncbi:anti-sigma factor family protein [Blastococcus sp. SYSU D00922]